MNSEKKKMYSEGIFLKLYFIKPVFDFGLVPPAFNEMRIKSLYLQFKRNHGWN